METLGRRLRKIRLEKGLTLEQVANRASLSKAFISQLENDKANPSLGSLKAVVGVFGLPVAALFGGLADDSEIAVVRKGQRKGFNLPESDVKFELLSPDTNRKMEFLYTTAEPGVRSSPRRFAHEGEECGIIIQGTLRLRVGDREFILEEGDSVYFPSNIPHDWENIGDVPVESIWVITPPSF